MLGEKEFFVIYFHLHSHVFSLCAFMMYPATKQKETIMQIKNALTLRWIALFWDGCHKHEHEYDVGCWNLKERFKFWTKLGAANFLIVKFSREKKRLFVLKVFFQLTFVKIVSSTGISSYLIKRACYFRVILIRQLATENQEISTKK